MTTAPSAPELIDTRDMICVHVFLRREFRLAAGVLREVRAGDQRRSRVVADHLEFITRFLHNHHTAEDELLWPRLLERVPDELAPIVHLMETQHEAVDSLLQQINDLLPRWRGSAATDDRDRLAALFEALYPGLAEHLDAEEQRLLPLAARSITLPEWHELGRAGVAVLPRSEMPLVLGMFQYQGDPDVVAQIAREAPLLIRSIVPLLARRAFRKHALSIHGTSTP
jgi:hemerythrin-like domain-containing protein